MEEAEAARVEELTEQVFCFLEELRPERDLGLHAFISVQELLLGLAARDQLPDNAAALESYLRPLLCRSPEEQSAFPERYREFLSRQARRSVLPPKPTTPSPEPRRWERLRQNDVWSSRAAFLVLALIALNVGNLGLKLLQTQDESAPVAQDSTSGGAGGTAGQQQADAGGGLVQGGSGALGGNGGAVGGSAGASQPPQAGAGTAFRDLDPIVTERAEERRDLTLSIVLLIAFAALVLVLRSLWVRGRVAEFLSAGSTAGSDPEKPARSAASIIYSLKPPPIGDRLSFAFAGAALRRRVAAGFTELDLAESIRRTAENAGFFQEVRRERTRVPEYLFLLERRNSRDFECAHHDALLNRLAETGVNLKRFYFSRSAAIVQPATGRSRSIDDLAGHFHAHRIGIFAEPELLVDSLTGNLAPWVLELSSFTQPVLFTSGNRDIELRVVKRLAAAGIRVIAATPTGLATAFGLHGRTSEDAAADGFAETPPAPLRHEPRVWMAPDPPDAEELTRCLAQVRQYLGPEGYFWLSACAMYPELRFELAVELAHQLDLWPHVEGELTRRLCALPWMREARMPSWLRRRLLSDLSANRREQIRQAIERILVAGSEPGDSGARLHVLRRDPEVVRAIYRRVSRAWQERKEVAPTGDAVFLGAMQDDLSVRVGRTLRSVGYAFLRQARLDLPARDTVQSAYGALLLAAVSQLVCVLLGAFFGFPVSNLTTVAAATVLLASFLAVPHASAPAGGAWQPVVLGARRSVVLLACLIGLVLPHVNLGFGIGRDSLKVSLEDRPEAPAPARRIDWMIASGEIVTAEFSPDGERILTADGESARLWNGKTLTLLALLLDSGTSLTTASFSPDGRRVVTGNANGGVRLWDGRTGKLLGTIAAHNSPVVAASFSPDGQRLVTGARESEARVWDVRSGRRLESFPSGYREISIAMYTPNGERVLLVGDGDAVLINEDRFTPLVGVPGAAASSIRAATFSRDGRRLATRHSNRTLQLWDGRSGLFIASTVVPDVRDDDGQEVFSPDGTRLVRASPPSSEVAFYDASTLAPIELDLRLPPAVAELQNPAKRVAFSPDGKRVVAGYVNGTALIWEPERRAEPTAILKGMLSSVSTVSFSADGDRVLTAGPSSVVELWDVHPNGRLWLDPTNLVILMLFLGALGVPVALFQRARYRALGIAVILAGVVTYKVYYPNIRWDVTLPWRYVSRDLVGETWLVVLRAAWPLGVAALVAGFGSTLRDLLLPQRFAAPLIAAQSYADRFAFDRLLFDRKQDTLANAGRTRTALGAAILGVVAGVVIDQDFWDTMIWLPVISVAVAAVVLAYPFLATVRYRAGGDDGDAAEARMSFEYALIVALALYCQSGWSSTHIGVFLGAAVLSWVSCRLTSPVGSPKLAQRLERLGPDRLLGTDPVFLSVVYVGVLALAGFFVYEARTRKPDPVAEVAPVSSASAGTAGRPPISAGGSGGSGGSSAAAGTASPNDSNLEPAAAWQQAIANRSLVIPGQVTDGWLVDTPFTILRQETKNQGGALTAPLYLVLHTSLSPFTAAVSTLRNTNTKSSVHFVIGRDGQVLQMVPLNRVAWHAGEGKWRGRSGVNALSLSIMLENLGNLRGADGNLASASNPAVWQPFPVVQLRALADLISLLQAGYSFCEILGHSDVATAHKNDPGPAFPMDSVRATFATELERSLATRPECATRATAPRPEDSP